ncbi:MAG: sigma-70 family RNA polymerase sigma factor [Myxococcales bacterium]|nr:sigma-70 family RNA polymerase sigma factor [Myxococcales bacterium]
MDDGDLLERWRAGDRHAGQELVKRHYDALFMFLWGKLDEQTSADLTQDTFETLCAGADRFRGDSSVRTYLLGIARWKLVNHLRRVQKNRERFDPMHDGIDVELTERSMTSLFARREQEALLVRGLRSLPLDDQLLLELKEYEHLPARELAEIFGVPQGTMAGRIARARERLRQAVEGIAGSESAAEQASQGLDSYFRGLREVAREVAG